MLAQTFQLLQPTELAAVEAVCRSFRAAVVQHELWAQTAATATNPVLSLRPSPTHAHATPGAGAGAAGAPDAESIHNLLTPRVKAGLCYYSSGGSEDEASGEVITFRLAHPLCRVDAVELAVFRAWFQEARLRGSGTLTMAESRGHPLYAPKGVRITLGGVSCFHPNGSLLPAPQLLAAAHRDIAGDAAPTAPRPPAGGTAAAWRWQSAVLPVAGATDALQQFEIEPTICVGGYLRLDLLGRTQRQAADDAFYTCLSYVRAIGCPVYGFVPPALPAGIPGGSANGTGGGAGNSGPSTGGPSDGAPIIELELVPPPADPLAAAGGLCAVSEGGRLLQDETEDESLSELESEEEEGEEFMAEMEVALGAAAGGGSIVLGPRPQCNPKGSLEVDSLAGPQPPTCRHEGGHHRDSRPRRGGLQRSKRFCSARDLARYGSQDSEDTLLFSASPAEQPTVPPPAAHRLHHQQKQQQQPQQQDRAGDATDEAASDLSSVESFAPEEYGLPAQACHVAQRLDEEVWEREMGECNALLASMPLPMRLPYVPLSPACPVARTLAASVFQLPPIACCMGASYFQRLLATHPDLFARAQRLSYFPACRPHPQASMPAPPPSARVTHRIEFRRELSAILSILTATAVSTEQAAKLERNCLVALEWRLGPFFNPTKHGE
eukprot:scaffold16.g130.t1